ncbi:MAG TPA: phosphatase PAP2 family protein [Streptosporangiaceae bacterium]|nr:phosphatase PAP2 family protein [Streptosporangiaceae bacterium]
MSEDTGRVAAGDGPAGLPPGPAAGKVHRQRRPSGAPPPLPHPATITTTAWLVLAAVVLAAACVAAQDTPWLRVDDRAGTWVLGQLAAVRTPWLTDVANGINAAGSGWGASVLALSVVAVTIAFRRWRHLAVFAGSLLVLGIAGTWIYDGLSRPRPYGVPIIGSWAGYASGSPVTGFLTFCLMGVVYCLVVPGRARSWAKAAAAAVVTVFGLARLYLGVDHPDDVLLGAALAVALAVTAFGYFTPNEIFPVTYRRGRTAHVDVTGRRGEAIRRAVADQLGLDVTEIKPVGLASSAGSTPLRLRIAGGPERFVFAKLYTKGHVRADRWYKLGRAIAYGALEDEAPFQTVRRLAEYEDYALHLVREAGVRTARPYGIVEITPEREYLVITEFFKGAVEIGQAEVDDAVIDQGLAMIRKLWDAGIAHRDIKPGNLMVRAGELLLIDVAFAQVRPSPWRQAVDLGNMMLVLAIRSDPQRVYRRARAYFTEAELAEAFAATRGVASPTQLRAFMRRDPRDLLGEFRALAPPRPPIALQRWSARRVALAAAALVITAAAVVLPPVVFLVFGLIAAPFLGPRDLGVSAPSCGTGPAMILSAQAVPSAAMLPCITALPSGWSIGGAHITSGNTRFWLDSDRAGPAAITVTLTAACDTSGAQQVPSGQPGTRRFDLPPSQAPGGSALRFYTFPGGCITYQFSNTFIFAPGVSPALASAGASALSFRPRSALVDYVRRTEGLALCGRGAACPP